MAHKDTVLRADICMFVHNHVSSDARVLKEAASLAARGWRVVVVGVDLIGVRQPAEEIRDGFTIRRVMPHMLPSRSGSWVKLLRLVAALPVIVWQLRRANARVYHGHDFPGLLVMALAGIWRRPVVYDSHELFFEQFPPDYALKRLTDLIRPLEKILAQRAAAMITVGDAIADRLAQTLGVPRPVVVRNAVEVRALGPAFPIAREAGQRVVIHSGHLAQGRHLPELVAALAHLPPDVVLVLLGNGPLKAALAQQAKQNNLSDRLLFADPVPVPSVAPTMAQADGAVVLTSPSYEVALPNKFFEAVAAGLPLVATPLLEVAALVRQYDIGVVCDPTDPHDIARAVQMILEPDNNRRFRTNALRACAELTWEGEEIKLLALYDSILAS